MDILAQQKIINDLSPKKFGKTGKLWVTGLSLICVVGLAAYIHQLQKGLVITAMRDYASWGIYISNFVFFVAISLVGSLISAVLKLSNVKWSIPLTRIAEMIAIAAITFAGLIIIVDMGRPERFYNLFIHGRMQSPIIWDVIVISTYLLISILFLYFPLLPDLNLMLRFGKKENAVFNKLYQFLGGFWKNTNKQIKINRRAINLMAITIIPVAFAIHTVTSWLFATTYRPGWDSTNFGAYFISGAFLVGAGGVLIAMFIVQKAYHLDHYITYYHFDRMGKIVVMLALLYLYFNVNEFLVPAFKMKKDEEEHLMGLFTGEFSVPFWFAISTSMFLPIFILMFRKGRRPLPAFIAGLFVVIGSWFKRYLIVTPTLLHPFLPMRDVPANYKHYFPTWEEWAIAMGSLAGAMLIITILARIFPIIPIQETIDEFEQHEKA
ncbi:MAG TPA: NrfD/PsrC family molybdoenzyme membrane anchor subunit [Puia sp.]|nr:NrfD/PsrC family molybdoenzyme membrane anchor subunit [Puia sp.]